MAPRIDVRTERAYYHPDEVFRALVDVSNSDLSHQSPTTVTLLSLEAVCKGVEQIDPGWISSSYFADTPHFAKDTRKVFRNVLKTQPAQLAEGVDFFPGQERIFAVGLRLPKGLPPSFKGTSVRYSYDLEVTAKYQTHPFGQPSNGNPKTGEVMEKTVKRSFQVRVHKDLGQSILRSLSGQSMIGEEQRQSNDLPMVEVKFQSEGDMVRLQWGELERDDCRTSRSETSSRHLSGNLESFTPHGLEMDGTPPNDGQLQPQNSAQSASESEFSMHTMGHLHRRSASSDVGTPTAGRKQLTMTVSQKTYNLRLGDQNLVRFSLNPGLNQELHPGSTFGGVLDFRESVGSSAATGKQCISVSVMLETEEEIQQAWLPPSLKARDGCVIRRLYCEHVELTTDVLMTSFSFSIPPGAPCSFRTPLLTLRWVLSFEFTVGEAGQVDSAGIIRKPNNRCEQLNWRLPVTVKPV
ncbi:hypothetical protein BSKO_08954 [Bryopsis sp. KO-2023]|nr:hypothetical protein BSKO_08954 [Bryopsis sp. KO-2023]